jgi:hypothetical protein
MIIFTSHLVLALPAFPGAEGFGSETIGGRGGKIIEVTNLNDSGAGSFRDAVGASGARIVVFRVAGLISLKSQIAIANPYLTIAGQTAPGDGVTFKIDSTATGKTPIKIATHDVIMRYLRIRPGSSPLDTGNLDALDVTKASNVIVDHCSLSWGTDEILTVGESHDVTLQWNIIAEGLDFSTHPKGDHSKGLMFWMDTKNVSAHHNLVVHNRGRNPNVNGNGGVIDLVSNVFYNGAGGGGSNVDYVWGEVKDKFGLNKVNFVNNLYKEGPSSQHGSDEIVYYHDDTWTTPPGGFQKPQVFVSGNIGYHRATDSLAQDLVVRPDSRFMLVSSAFAAPAVTAKSAGSSFDEVIAKAGAMLPVRDAHDLRAVNDAKNATGKVISDPKEVGGWLVVQSATAPTDSDHDGMPDSYETTMGFNPNDASDGPKDVNLNGYTNVEEYINGIGGNVQPPPPPPTCTRANPELKFVNGALAGKAGDTLSYTLSVKNLDSSNCAASTFNFSNKLASGLSAKFSMASAQLQAGQSINFTISVTSATSMVKAVYQFSVSAISVENPTFTATAAATYEVLGSEPPPPPPSGGTLTILVSEDASIKKGNSGTNFGTMTYLATDGSPVEEFLMKFSVTGIGTKKIKSIKLRLYNVNKSDQGGSFYSVASNSWSEKTVTYSNAPISLTTAFAKLGSVAEGKWYEVDLSSLIKADGTFSIRTKSSSDNGADYASKEKSSTYAPRIVIIFE